MRKVVLDTNVLINNWRRSRSPSLASNTARQAEGWATQLITLHETDAIVTPVYVEMVAGVLTGHELNLTRAYLGKFRRIDEGRILPADWEAATRLAQRIPRQPKARDLGDCLIRAIAKRLSHEVLTLDRRFPD
jgi:predicted nucleic acid-binding protein